MRTIVMLVIVLGATSPLHAEPHKTQVRYVGIHPIPKSEGGGICYIQGPHVHTYAADKLQYRVHDGANFFVGDPVAYGYEGPRYTYKGNHPIQVETVLDDDDPDVEYCYLDGPHYHTFAPVDGPDWKLVGGAYFYVGAPPKPYLAARPTMLRINAVYQPLVYARPTITVEAPAGWINARAEVIAIRAPVVRRPHLDYDYDIAVPEIYVVEPEPVYYYELVFVEEHWKVKHHHGHWH